MDTKMYLKKDSMSERGLHYSDQGKASVTGTFENDKERVCPIK